MDPTQILVIVLATLIMGWYALGVIWNVRSGNAVMRWMQDGLPRLGERTTVRWLGSSVVELGLARAKAPFRKAEVILVLEPRDVPWLWIPSWWRGRRDMLIIRAQLGSAPKYEYDLLSPGSWSEHERLRRAFGREWETEPLDGFTLRAPAATRPLSRQMAPAVLSAAQQVYPVIWRLSSRRDYPQLELHVPLPNPRRDDASQFFAALRSLAEQLSAPAR